MLKGFKTKIKFNNRQRTAFLQHAGVARHAWNWGLDLCINCIRKQEKLPSAIDLHKLLVKEVKTANPWYYESSKCSPQQALRMLPEAFSKFWKKHREQSKLPANKKYVKKYLVKYAKKELAHLGVEHEKGFPRFKRKGEHDSFYLEASIILSKNKIKVPKIGWLKTYEQLPDGQPPKNVVISRVADDWFISFRTEVMIKQTTAIKSVGVDLGIKTLATLSDGRTFGSPRLYKIRKNKLRRLQRSLSRKYEVAKIKGLKPGSNHEKNKQQIARVHQRIADVRRETIHQLTSYLVKNHNRIVIEDLNIGGMVKNRNLASAILDGGFYEFRRQLTYKCAWYGVELIVADRWFASSKTCSCCGHKQDMPLKTRTFVCEACGLVIDRDLNAAINLNNYTPSFGVKVCGDAKFQAEKPVGVDEAEIRCQTEKSVCVSS